MKKLEKPGKPLSKDEQKKIIAGEGGEGCKTVNQTGCGPGDYCCAGLTCVNETPTICRNV